jgi:ribosomal protein L11 methyltransferase
MLYEKVSVETVSGACDVVAAVLIGCGINGVQIEDNADTAEFLRQNKNHWDYVDESLVNVKKNAASVIFYVRKSAAGNEALLRVKDALRELGANGGMDYGTLELSAATVDEDDWLQEWKKHYKPFKIGGITVKPDWEEYTPEEGETVLTINPGSVFGTGLHESTRLCMAELEKTVKAGDNVLDIGCGSGILSVTALLFGAGSVTATDIEPAAEAVSVQNAALNGFVAGELTVHTGNVLTDKMLFDLIKSKEYDIVTANIIADVIIKLAPLAAESLKQGGLFISSGIILSKAVETRSALERNGFSVKEEYIDGEWVCLSAVKT